MNVHELLAKLISFDTQGTKTNKDLVDFVVSLFPAEQVTITPLKKGELEIYNLMIKIAGMNSDNPLIFSGHTDTVPVTSQWTRNPFEPSIEGNRMYGLGSTDMKAGVAAFLTAALELTERPQQDIYLLLDADEEDLGLGGRQFVKDLNLTNANIIVAEPSDCSIMIGQKGALTMEAKFQGTPTHGSRTSYDYNQQNSAIYKAVRGIAELQKLEADYINQKLEEYGFPTLNIGRIQGGVATNVVAGDCLFSIDRRFLPNEDPQQIIADITNAIITVDESAVVEAQFVGEAFNLEKESELFKTLTDVQTKYFGESKSCIMTGWTQAGLFKKWGSPVIFGPGQLAQAHQADEYCEIDVLEKFVGCYREIIQKLAY